MSAETLKKAAAEMRLDATYEGHPHPGFLHATADLLTALARELERGDYAVESDVLPTWLHCHLDNIAHHYLAAEESPC